MDYNILRQPSECCWMMKKKKKKQKKNKWDRYF